MSVFKLATTGYKRVFINIPLPWRPPMLRLAVPSIEVRETVEPPVEAFRHARVADASHRVPQVGAPGGCRADSIADEFANPVEVPVVDAIRGEKRGDPRCRLAAPVEPPGSNVE